MYKFSTILLFGVTLLASSSYLKSVAAADIDLSHAVAQSSKKTATTSAIRLPTRPVIELPGRGIDPESYIGQIQSAAKQSDAVLLGRVVSKESKWIGKVIVTTATMTVIETMKGKASRRVRVSYPGGTVGVIAQYVTHTPALQIGETAVVFVDEPRSKALQKLGSFEFSTEKSKIAILAPEQDVARLNENVRLKRNINRIRAAVK